MLKHLSEYRLRGEPLLSTAKQRYNMNRNQLNLMASSLGITPANFPNDSKLEQKILYVLKNTYPVTGTLAASTLTSDNTEVTDGDTVTIGAITYRFKDTPAQAYDVKRNGTTADTTLGTNLRRAINGTGTPGTEYFVGTSPHPLVTCGAISSHACIVTANDTNVGSNIATTTTAAHLSWTSTTLAGGTPGVAGVIAVAGASTRDTVAGVAGDSNVSL